MDAYRSPSPPHSCGGHVAGNSDKVATANTAETSQEGRTQNTPQTCGLSSTQPQHTHSQTDSQNTPDAAQTECRPGEGSG